MTSKTKSLQRWYLVGKLTSKTQHNNVRFWLEQRRWKDNMTTLLRRCPTSRPKDNQKPTLSKRRVPAGSIVGFEQVNVITMNLWICDFIKRVAVIIKPSERSSHERCSIRNRCSWKFCKIHRKTSVPESLF